MRDLVIFAPSIEDGGVEKNLFLIANFFAKKGLLVNLITANRDKKKFFDKRVKFLSPKSNFLNKKNRFYKTIYCFFLLIKFHYRYKNFLIFSFQANIYAIFYAYFFNLDIITRSNTAPSGWSSNPLKRLIFKVFFQYPKKIVVNSLDFKKQLDKEFSVSSVCIYNPFDAHLIKKKIKKKVSFNFFKKGYLNFINIGRLTHQKNQILLLRLFKLIGKQIKYKLLIIGKGKKKQQLQNFINKNKLQKNIKLLHYKINPYPYLNKAHIFILSSLYEGLPNVLLEAQYLKKLTLSSNCPTGPREILLNGKSGFLYESNNLTKLKKLVLFISDKKNKDLLKKKIKIGHNSIDRFDYNKNMKKYYKLILKYL